MDPSNPGDVPGGDVRARLRRALGEALSARDKTAVSALRSALGAIDNAQAVHPGSPPAAAAGNPHFAGAVTGLGAAEAERRGLSEAEAGEIVRAEVAERQAAAAEYERAGHIARADRLRREARVLMSAAGGGPAR